MEKFDHLDRRILALLQRDAGIALENLGEQVGLSRNAVWRRVKALEDRGVIRARVALLDPEALGLGLTVFMLIRTDRHAPDWMAQFAAATRDMPEILGAYRMTGDLDYLIRARVADVKAYDRLYQELVRRVALQDVSASFVMEEIKETTALPLQLLIAARADKSRYRSLAEPAASTTPPHAPLRAAFANAVVVRLTQ